MGFANFVNQQEASAAKKVTSGLTSKLKTDVSTPEGLAAFATSKGISAPATQGGFIGFLKKGAQSGMDALLWTSRRVGEAIQSFQGKKWEEIDHNLMPSEALFGKTKEFASIGESLKYQFTTADGLKRFAADVLLDPLTYVTLGTGSAIKIAGTTGAKIALEKTGKELLKDLAEEIVDKGISRSVALGRAKEMVGAVVEPGLRTIEQRGGLGLMKKAMAKTGLEFTADNVRKVLKEGIPDLIRKSDVRFLGKKIFELPNFSKIYSGVSNSVKQIEQLKPVVEGIERTGKAIAKLFDRDFGLPKPFVEIKQRFIDSFDRSKAEIKNNLITIFAGTTKEQRIAVTQAIEGGTISSLDQTLKPLAQRSIQILKSVAREEEKRGLLDKTIEQYIPHIYKDSEKAQTIIESLRKGQATANLRFNKARILPGLEDAKTLGLEPIEDIGELLNLRLIASEKAKLTQDFIGEVGTKLGVAGKIGKVKEVSLVESAEESMLINNLNKSISDNFATPIKDFFDSTGKLIKDFNPFDYRFKDMAAAKESLYKLRQLNKLKDDYANALVKGGEEAKQSVLSEIKNVFSGEQKGFELGVTKRVQFWEQNPELRKYFVGEGEKMVKLSDAIIGVPSEFKDIHIPNAIAKDIAVLEKRFFDDESAVRLLRGYDKIMNFWKGSVTVMFPAFHFRNALSNVAQNFLDIGVNAFNPATHKTVIEILFGAEGKITTELGEEISYNSIRKAMKESQVFQDNLARTDLGRKLDENILAKSSPIKWGRQVGRAIENEARVVNFVVNLKRGMDFEQAAERAKQFLFDYDNLSLFEKDVLRRAIPFYTWTRKNISLELKGLLTQPGRQAAQFKAFNSLGEMFAGPLSEDDKKVLPLYVQQGINLLIAKKGDDRSLLAGFQLPLESFFTLVGQASDNSFKTALNQLAPPLKILIEGGTGTNIFLGKAIKDDATGTFARNMPDIVKDFLDYSERTVKAADGRTYQVMTVDPQKKWIFRNLTSLIGIGRLSSTSVVDGATAIYKGFSGQPMTVAEKIDILNLFSGLDVTDYNMASLKSIMQKEEMAALTAELERKGLVAEFTKTFVPADSDTKLESKLK